MKHNEISIVRNPLIADLFHRMGEVEKVGSGIKRMRDAAKAAGVPAPQFEATGFFTITYRKTPTQSQPESQLESELESELESLKGRVMAVLYKQPLGKAKLAGILGQKQASGPLHQIIRELLDEGLIERTIPDKPNSRLQKYRSTQKSQK